MLLASLGFKVRIGTRTPAQPRPIWLTNGDLQGYSTHDSAESIAPSLVGVDTVVHLASPNEHTCAKSPETALQEISIATLRLCEAAAKANVKHFIYFSTAHVYASPLHGNFNEESKTEPKHPYAYAHLAAEHIVASFAENKKIPKCTVIRLSNGMGAPERYQVDRWTLLVNDLCTQAIQSSTLKLNSDGRGLRDFVTLTDVANALLHIIAHPHNSTFEVYNLARGKSASIIAITEMVVKQAQTVLNKNLTIQKKDPENSSATPPHLAISIDKLARTGFQWTNNFEKEIADTLLLCRENIR
jgi:UDP-glucose 4-epimerase